MLGDSNYENVRNIKWKSRGERRRRRMAQSWKGKLSQRLYVCAKVCSFVEKFLWNFRKYVITSCGFCDTNICDRRFHSVTHRREENKINLDNRRRRKVETQLFGSNGDEKSSKTGRYWRFNRIQSSDSIELIRLKLNEWKFLRNFAELWEYMLIKSHWCDDELSKIMAFWWNFKNPICDEAQSLSCRKHNSKLIVTQCMVIWCQSFPRTPSIISMPKCPPAKNSSSNQSS